MRVLFFALLAVLAFPAAASPAGTVSKVEPAGINIEAEFEGRRLSKCKKGKKCKGRPNSLFDEDGALNTGHPAVIGTGAFVGVALLIAHRLRRNVEHKAKSLL